MNLSTVLGERLRALRESRHERQEDLAEQLRAYGLDWSRAVVTAVEAGRREVTVPEFIILCAALDTPPWEWFAEADHDAVAPDAPGWRSVELTPRRVTSEASLHRLMRGDLAAVPPPSAPEPGGATAEQLKELEHAAAQVVKRLDRRWPTMSHTPDPEAAWADAAGEAEQKAARKLGLSPVELSLFAHALWGRGLSDERDARASEREPVDLDERALQIRKGHVTRRLLTELRAVIEPEGEDDHGRE